MRPATTLSLAPDERGYLRQIITYGFLIRAGLAMVLVYTGYSRRFAPDEQTYAANGWQLALYWAGEQFILPARFSSDQPLGYFYMNGAFFYLFGRTEIPIKLLNALVGALSVRYVYLMGRHLFGMAVARRASFYYMFFPSLVLWSALNIRDVWVIFLILFISWHSLAVVKGYSHLGLFNVALGTLLLTFLRDYLFFVVALPPVVAFLIGRRGHLVRNFVLALAAGLVVLTLLVQGAVGEHAVSRMSLEAMSKVRQDMATGGSSFHEDVDISTPGRAIAFLPVGIAYFLFSPFPWEITSFLKMFSLPEMLLIYMLVPAMIRGIAFAIRERLRESLQILLFTALLTVAYALGEGNVGTLYRHRAQALAFYLMFAAAGIELTRGRARPQVAA